MEKYFILGSSEDGLSISKPLTKEQLQKELKEPQYESDDIEFMTEDSFDPYKLSFHMGKKMIIKGKILSPKPKEVVVEYDFE